MQLPSGFKFAGVSCGLKSRAGAKDLTLIVSDLPCSAAGVYTTNQVVAAPVLLCRERTPSDKIRGVVINSGCANACTGARGIEDARKMTELVATTISNLNGHRRANKNSLLVMSTGVIGRFLPMEKIESGIQQAAEQLSDDQSGFLNAADGILTTDASRKISSRQIKTKNGQSHNLVGMAKGAGMIGPKMATMLACLITDAPLVPKQAQAILQSAADRSFNCISVEGHTSTNDSLVLLSTGVSHDCPALSGADAHEFEDQLTEMCIELAKKIPDDGEGATHLIEVRIHGAKSDHDADKIARSVASSNLVKTAITGGDPNWGRIVSAAGYAGVTIDTTRLALKLNGLLLFDRGEPISFVPKEVSQSIKSQKLTTIELIVGTGPGQATHWTSDLNCEYVKFNSEYTT